MIDERVQRINELARKSRTPEGLTDEEKEEQQRLRQEYIQAYRAGMRAQLESIVIVDEKGNRRKVRSNKEKKK